MYNACTINAIDNQLNGSAAVAASGDPANSIVYNLFNILYTYY